jgi:hypothetical protein
MLRESLDAPDDLPNQVPRQVALGQLADKVLRTPDDAPSGFEWQLLEARQGPALDGERQDKPAREVPLSRVSMLTMPP